MKAELQRRCHREPARSESTVCSSKMNDVIAVRVVVRIDRRLIRIGRNGVMMQHQVHVTIHGTQRDMMRPIRRCQQGERPRGLARTPQREHKARHDGPEAPHDAVDTRRPDHRQPLRLSTGEKRRLVACRRWGPGQRSLQ